MPFRLSSDALPLSAFPSSSDCADDVELANVQLPVVGVSSPSSGSSAPELWKSPKSPKSSSKADADRSPAPSPDGKDDGKVNGSASLTPLPFAAVKAPKVS